MESKDKMLFSTIAFTFSGVLQMLTALWFWQTKNQDIYFWGMIVLLIGSLILLCLVVPESPVFLLENERYDDLEIALYRIGKFNGVSSPIYAKYSFLRLQQTK